MLTEIFDERELCPDTLTREPDTEALDLIHELGLKAQVAESGARICYPTPTTDQTFVLRVLFPQMTKLEQYDAGAIPLRVLKEIRSYRAENPGHRLYVLHSAPAVMKDPVLISCSGQYDFYDKNEAGKWRLIARWGDALESWETLMERAMERHGKAMAQQVKTMISKLTILHSHLTSGGTVPPTESGEMPAISNLPAGF